MFRSKKTAFWVGWSGVENLTPKEVKLWAPTFITGDQRGPTLQAFGLLIFVGRENIRLG